MNKTETRDVQGGWAVLTAGFLLIMFLAVIAFSYWHFERALSLQTGAEENYSLPLQTEGPRPGAWTAISLKRYRNIEEAKLGSYAWKDSSHTYAIVPIDRAIDLAVENKNRTNPKGDKNAP